MEMVSIWVLFAAVSFLAAYWLMSSNARDDVAYVPGPDSESLIVGACNLVSPPAFF